MLLGYRVVVRCHPLVDIQSRNWVRKMHAILDSSVLLINKKRDCETITPISTLLSADTGDSIT